MNAPSSSLRLSSSARDAVISDVSAFGRLGVESGAFLLAPRDRPDVVAVVALLGEDGVVRRRGLFVVTAPVIDRLFTYAEEHDLLLRCLVHSHEGEAFMSPTDKEGTIRVPGFVAAIIPDFADPPADANAWGWWSWTEGQWAPSPPADVLAGATGLIRCDSTGVLTLDVLPAATDRAGTASTSSEPVAGRGHKQPAGRLRRLVDRLWWWRW